MRLSEAPIYNLRAVVRETGLHADTVRVWERRYGLPKPRRSPGGHRLYSEGDIYLIKWLQSRQAEGLSISRAAEQWRQLIASGADPWTEAGEAERPRAEPSPSAVNRLNDLREQWISACLAYDEAGANQALNYAFGLYSAETVVLEVLQPALHALGERWRSGQVSVQQEHFASAMASRRLESMIASTPAPSHPEALLLACPETELHSLPLQFLALLLRRRGYRVVYLGADVPLSELDGTINSLRPALVVMAAQGLRAAASLRATSQMLSRRHTRLAYAGRAFSMAPELRADIAGNYIGDSMGAALPAIEQLLAHPRAVHRPGSHEPNPAWRQYVDAQPRIEINIQRRFVKTPLPARHLMSANTLVGDSLAAALELGRVDLMELDLPAIVVVLQAQGMPSDGISDYLRSYGHSVRRALGTDGAEIATWLEARAKSVAAAP